MNSENLEWRVLENRLNMETYRLMVLSQNSTNSVQAPAIKRCILKKEHCFDLGGEETVYLWENQENFKKVRNILLVKQEQLFAKVVRV